MLEKMMVLYQRPNTKNNHKKGWDTRGRGSITKSGYIRYQFGHRRVFGHVLVWESIRGKVPDGYEIHHIDGIKTNNNIDNLKLVTRREHRRIHEGWKMRDGNWYKICSGCGVEKCANDSNFYIRESGVISGKCKPCHVKEVCAKRKLRCA